MTDKGGYSANWTFMRPIRIQIWTRTYINRQGRLTLPISGPLRGGLVARPVQAGPERRARGLPNGNRNPHPDDSKLRKP